MLSPQFPYKSDQLILSSNRIVLHSKEDAIFLFGKAAIGLSSTQTINLDANEKILIDCQKIELGNKAEIEGEPIVLGNTLNEKLIRLLELLSAAGEELQKVNTNNMGSSMDAIRTAGLTITRTCSSIKNELSDKQILSKNTFTR